jgi:hypothetical protein
MVEKSNQFSNYLTSLAMEHDELCGIEVAPSFGSDASAFTILEYHTSGNMNSNDLDSLSLTYSSDSTQSEEENVEYSNSNKMGTPLVSSLESGTIRNRVQELIELLDDSSIGEKLSIFPKHIDYINHDQLNQCKKRIRQRRCPEGPRTPRNTRESKRVGAASSSQGALVKTAGYNIPKHFINLLNPSPNDLFNQLMARSHHALFQILIDNVDVQFLFNPGNATNNNTPLVSAPQSKVGDLRDMSNTSLPHDQIIDAHLTLEREGSDCESDPNNQRDPTNCHKVPPQGKSHLPEHELWQAGEEGISKQTLIDGDKVDEPLSNSFSETQDPNQIKQSEVIDLVRDEDLKAFLKFTNGGEDFASLFPSIPSDEVNSTICSDDGMGEEMNALEKVIQKVQKELAFVEYAVKPSISATSKNLPNPGKSKKFDKKPSKDFDANDTDTTMSITDSEGSQDLSDSTQHIHASSSAQSCTNGQRKGKVPSQDCCVDVNPRNERRRVHFGRNSEYVYQVPSIETVEDAYQESQSSAWVDKLEEAYLVWEELLDEISLSCARYVEKNRREPSFKKPVRASNAHYI